MNDFGLLVGKYLTALPTLTTGQYSELILDESGRLIISGRYLEDAAHTTGDAGLHILAVRQDTIASLVDTDGDYASLKVNAQGALYVQQVGDISLVSEYAEDSAHVSGDVGQFILAVRNDAEASLVGTDGDYAPLQVDANGRLKVATVVNVEPSDAEFLEDAAHASGDAGLHVLAVRQDTLVSSTSADGDYASFKVTDVGELYVHDVDANATLVTIDTSLNNIETDIAAIETELLDQGLSLDSIDTSLNNIETDVAAIETELLDQGTTLDTISTEIQSLTHAEDVSHVSGDVGIMSLAVRNDADASLVSADGDYAPLQVDSIGRLKITGQVEVDAMGTEAYTVTDALAAAGDGLETITAAATPWVTVASLAVGAGVNAYVYGWQFACDQNCQARLITDDTTDIIVYKTSVNSSAQPAISEHFSEGGRIEIAGAANLEIKIQIKKRSATGGNALGTGSVHVRTL